MRSVDTIDIGGIPVGPGHACLVIAEAGVNHNGDLETAGVLIDTARDAGAGAVKFQTFRADRLATPQAAKAEYQRSTTDPEESQHAMLRKLELDDSAHRQLMERCRQQGILFLSTPFDAGSADLLDELGVAAFKTSSGDLTDHPLLAHIAAKGKPMIVSTGMSDMEEVGRAVEVIRNAGCDELVLLHCVSCYPSDAADTNLRAMATLAESFDVPVGYSDHTEGIEVALAAAALGACIIEKHFTLDRDLPGPDHKASLEPDELEKLVTGIRKVESSLGDGEKRPCPSEMPARLTGRKSLVASRDLSAAHTLTANDLTCMRPGTGIEPVELNRVIGRSLLADLSRYTPLSWDVLEGGEPE